MSSAESRSSSSSASASSSSHPLHHRYLLHEAIYEDRLDLVRKLLEEEGGGRNKHFTDAPIIEEEDDRGNTALALSLKLARVDICTLLLQHGAKADKLVKQTEGAHYGDGDVVRDGYFTVIDLALLTMPTHYDIIRAIYLRQRSGMLRRFQEVVSPRMLQVMPQMKDFKIVISINFINPLSAWLTSFINYFTPSETYTIWKKGSLIRIDYSIKGVLNSKKNMSLKRGRYSLLFLLDESRGLSGGGGYKIIDVSWNKRKARNLIRKWSYDAASTSSLSSSSFSSLLSEKDLNLFLHEMMRDVAEKKKITHFNFNLPIDAVEIKRAKVKTFFGYDSATDLTETISGSPELAFIDGPAGVPVASGVKTEFSCEVWDVKARLLVNSTSVAATREKDMSFLEYFGYRYPGDYSDSDTISASIHMNQEDDEEGEGKHKDESSNNGSDSNTSATASPSFSRTEGCSSNRSVYYDKTLNSQLWMSKDIPLSLADFVQILEVAGIENKNFLLVKQILERHEEIYSSGCIAKIVVDLISGLQMQVKVDGYDDQGPINDTIFQIPKHFDSL
jgi:hypothetical protein